MKRVSDKRLQAINNSRAYLGEGRYARWLKSFMFGQRTFPTSNEMRSIFYDLSNFRWRRKTRKHRANNKLRRIRNRMARVSRRINRKG